MKGNFKHHCIFFHPEGQGEKIWEQNKAKAAKICHFAERGEICPRSLCRFYHPITKTSLFFSLGAAKQASIEREERWISAKDYPKLPQRVSLIVKNNLKQDIPDLRKPA